MEQLIRSFSAWDDRGNRIVLHEWEAVPEVKIGKGKAVEPNPRLIRTSAGRPVNRIAKGQYLVVQTGAIMRSTESDAP